MLGVKANPYRGIQDDFLQQAACWSTAARTGTCGSCR